MPLVSKNVLFVKISQLWAVESLFEIYVISIIYANLGLKKNTRVSTNRTDPTF